MKNQYQELRNRQQEEVNAFPMFFASPAKNMKSVHTLRTFHFRGSFPKTFR